MRIYKLKIKDKYKYFVNLFIIIFLIVSIFTATSLIIKNYYDINILDYIRYKLPLTTAEKEYLKKNKLVFGVDKYSAPLSFVNEENGQMEGLVVDYISALSIELETNIEYKAMNCDQIVRGLDNRNIQIADLFSSPERNKSLAFSQGIYTLRGIIVTTDDRTDLDKTNILKNKKIITIRGDYCNEILKIKGKNISIIQVENIKEAIECLNNGLADAFAGDKAVIDYYLRLNNLEYSYKHIIEDLYNKKVSLAVNKNDLVLLGILNKGILKIKDKDILNQGLNKWMGVPSLKYNEISSLNTITSLIFILISFAMIIYVWNTLLQKKIREKTNLINSQKDTLQAIFESIHSPILVIDKHNNVLEYNQSSYDICNKENIKGRNVEKLPILGKIYSDKSIKNKNIYFCNGKYYNLEERALIKNSHEKILIYNDITETILAERKLGQDSKMIAIGQLSAGLAHEIRNPLGLIKTYQFIYETSEDKKVSSHAANIINNSIDRINNLISNLLNFSKDSSYNFEDINIKNLLIGISDLQRDRAQKNGIDITVLSQDFNIITNEESLKIILINIIDNAVDAIIRKKQKIDFKGIIEIKSFFENGKLVLSISDNGEGMSESAKNDIFNPFFTTRDDGIGLGMYMVKNEIDKISADVSIISKMGEGTTFLISIPKL